MLKKLVIGVLILVLAPIGAAWLYWQWFKWGPRPDIHVQGQVIDRDGGHGVADAYVILAVRASTSSLGGTHSGCAEGSAVVRTDENGKFNYSITAREAFGPENPGGWGVTIYVYHPDFDADLERDLPAITMQRLAATRTPGGGWLERPNDLYLTFPHFYDKKKGWATIEVVKRTSSEWQQIDYFMSSPHYRCIDAPVERGHLALLIKMHERAWTAYCDSADDTNESFDPDGISAASAYFQFSSIKDAYLYNADGAISKEQREDISEAEDYVVRSILSEIPWNQDDESYGRAMTHPERRQFCEFYHPPLEEVLRKRPAQ
ncbi:hypothetical protein [Chiayiivirga flava]|uniref:Uncharacterized protein n=1 Tax=Chiayiivirga flava TaxID=659595 RepID=A0A7W8G1D5_9GAMM|nr:hypothetical protein [Chiayiivirga flava]MBB5209334.1 hypothetical protein [Chiayiivirga flava]